MFSRLNLLLLLSSWLSMILFRSVQGADCKPGCNLGHGRCDENGICRCDPGWEGELCDDCARMPGCVHGTCQQPWQCSCESGWTGRFCDRDINVCANQRPCQNGATCIATDGEYSCVCPNGFHGKDCELKSGPCQEARSPCKNGGLCTDDKGYAAELSCRCLAGYVGTRCEVNVDDCLMRPCANGATCHDGINRFSCECQAGFEGRFCTVNINDCASGPCLNGGRCFDRVNRFDCVCPPGYTGVTCSDLVEKPKQETRSQNWTPRSWTSGYPRVTLPWPEHTLDGARWNVSTPSHRNQPSSTRLLKISVKEVVTPQGSLLTEVQVIVLVVFGALTLAVVGLTTAVVLRGHWRERCSRCRCASQPDRRAKADEEFKISILPHTMPDRKKKLNTEII
ncbi:protein delta homolog 2 [Acipenser ruthenus]|nr:protein delta homolog 2 [Acipenser ruthenus]XP_033859240.3 protein delta homolog 2 [Acipenser ruthenus]XP_058879828.1 protein delta homolog 2 [Acipenser ruthenus]